EIAVPGFFRWAKDEGIVLPGWLTMDFMGRTTLEGDPVLFQDGKKLWSRFDEAFRIMKRDYNPIWDRFVRGQPGNNLPSGHTGDDAIDNLLDGLYARNAVSAEAPVLEKDLVESPPGGGGAKPGTEKENAGGGGARETSQESVDGGAAEKQQGEAGKGDGETDGIKQEPEDGDGGEDGDGSSGGLGGESGEYPARPTNWMSPYLITYCLIGRPSDSEDPDLRTARVTSGPRNRLGKRKAGLRATTSSGSSNEESETDSGEVGTGGNLDSTAIRTFAGAGEAQSRAKVKKETAAVHANVAQEKFRQQRMGQTEKLVGAVQTLSDAVVAKQRLDEEAAGRAREMAAEQRRATKIKNLKGEYELSDPESAEYFALRAALRFTFRQPLTDFLDNPASA
ncbi:unnamed protein product, partial [Pylaiella littoralis]